MNNTVSEHLIDDIYTNIANEARDNLSEYLVNYIDEIRNWKVHLRQITTFQQMLGEAISTGYFVRLTEEKLLSYNLLKPKKFKADNKVHRILLSKSSIENKMNKIVNHFDNIPEIAFGKPVRPYLLLDYKILDEFCCKYAASIICKWSPKLKKKLIILDFKNRSSG